MGTTKVREWSGTAGPRRFARNKCCQRRKSYAGENDASQQRRSIHGERTSPGSGGSRLIDQFNFQALINFAFIFCFGNLDAAHLPGVVDMRAPIRLEVQPDDLDDTYLLHFRWQ